MNTIASIYVLTTYNSWMLIILHIYPRLFFLNKVLLRKSRSPVRSLVPFPSPLPPGNHGHDLCQSILSHV